jgi:hypothetical protein
MMKRFTNAHGNPAFIDPVEVVALDSVYSDGSKDGGSGPPVKLLTRVFLQSGATIDLDADADHVAATLT